MSIVYKICDALILESYILLHYNYLTLLLLLIMHITWCFVAALLSGSALADCPNGPYKSGTLCAKSCWEEYRCGDNNHVVRLCQRRYLYSDYCSNSFYDIPPFQLLYIRFAHQTCANHCKDFLPRPL
jgi:hypothetical protein